ncbi:metallophosphoesterase [Massilia dura]|uniref:Metallophosphoesterase n=1 Tax=Pseudoduganella dura TaxID=321982 RepID=A0A6I3XA56_9BURK|nr:metallophosphoesterase [Pseudoduganella dura]MUI11490.1 metallophosphoesterase [Pseudoduganella dura]GGX97393.1 metallophosphoesterase [Pseudoduganella dura]
MFFPYLYLAFIYFVLRLIVPLPLGRAARIALALAVFLVCQHHQIQKWYFGTMFSPEIPRPFVILLGLLYCAWLLLSIMSLLVDLGLFVAWALRRGRAVEHTFMPRLRYAMFTIAALLSGVGVYQAIGVPEVRRVELAIRDLPPGLDGLRMVQLSDLHISRLMDAGWVRQVVGRTNALRPDLIVISGDLIDGTPQAREGDIAPLAGLRARHGVIASLGNHEYYFGAERWTREFERLGMTVLVNRHAVVDHGGSRMTVAGVADRVASRFDMAGPDTARALQGAAPAFPVILLSHQPIEVEANARAGVDVQLSGHTHGGMVRGIDEVVKRANGGYVSGRYSVGGMWLYVSNGTGLWNGFPIRLGVPAEITEFTLKRAPGQT